ncbi:MAG: phage terminase large subunit [Clostridiales bacterium]|nr:phage terminase large subunit [Clostridiales bacterium]
MCLYPRECDEGEEVRISRLIAPTFHAVHTDIRLGGHSEYWLQGGRGSGKSSFVSIEIILGMMRSPEANALVYRKVADTLRDSVLAQLWWAVEALGVADCWRRKVSPMEIEYLPTGQRILLRGADDPQKSKGIKLQKGFFRYLWFEELAEFDGMQALRTIKASAIRGGSAITFYTYNPPQSAASWINEEALRVRPGRMTHRSTYLDMPPQWLGEAFLSDAEALRQSDERTWRHMYLGEVTGTGGQVFENLELRPISDGEISRMGAFYDGLDFGYWPDPSHWVRVSYDPACQTVYVLDELLRYRTGDRELAGLLKERFRQWNEKWRTGGHANPTQGRQSQRDSERMPGKGPGMKASGYQGGCMQSMNAGGGHANPEIVCDSASEKPIADLRAEGLRATGAMKGPGSIETGIRWLRTRRRIVIDPARTPETAREFQRYEHEKNRAGEYVEGYPDRDNHAIDAVRYALNRVWLRKDR